MRVVHTGVADLASLRPKSLQIDGPCVANWTSCLSVFTIGRANLDGSGVDQGFIGGATHPYGVAGDSTSFPVGTATVTVTVPGPGKLVMTGSGIKRRVKRPAGAGKVKLTIRPSVAGTKKLKDSGRFKVRAKLAFTPTGGETKSRSLRLTLSLAG